ncbi:hypothetical protein [Streptomyces sp. NPDC050416]
MAVAPFRSRGQQRSHTIPQVVQNKINTHLDTLSDKITEHKIRD